jgi:hypothetical protein
MDGIFIAALRGRLSGTAGSAEMDQGKVRALWSRRENRLMKTVWIYIDTRYIAGDPRHLKVFATFEVANDWFEQYDLEGVAFEYPIISHAEWIPRRCWMTMMMRMMQSEIVSPCRRNCCSRSHVTSLIGIRQLPFGKRRPVAGPSALSIRARHSSVISIACIVWGSCDGRLGGLMRAGVAAWKRTSRDPAEWAS